MAETVRIEIPIETIDETESGVRSATRNLDSLSGAANRAGRSFDNARTRVSRFDETQERTQRKLSQWVKEKYEVLLEAKERITPILRTLGTGLRNLAGKTWRITMRAIDFVTAPVRGIINILKNPIFQVGAVLGVSIGLKDSIDTYKDFEAAMSKVQAISGATGSDMEKLNAKAKEMGATTKFTATEAAEAFNYMGMAGWKSKDMIDGIEGILNLAAASGEDLGSTSDIVTDALTAFRLEAKDSGHFADVLAQASSNANTNVSMLGESFKYIAPVAGAMKYSVEDVSLALGLMANSSVKGSMAGTSLKTALVNMTKPTDKMAAAMEKYGISLTDKNGKMKSLKGVMDNLRKSLGGLAEAEQTSAAGTIFGKEAMAGMLSIINASEKDYNKLTKAVNNADGASKKMSDTMLDNLQGSITLLQSELDGVKLSFGKRLSPYVRGLADWLKDSMPAIEDALEDMMDWVDRKVDSIKSKFKEISMTDEWQTSDFMGKAGILWDEFIANPFSEWWNSTGKAKIADALGSIGEAMGSGLHMGIMALLGFDVSDTLNEGVSMGSSFAKGFAEGFDFSEISSKLWEGLKNVVKSAAKLLPGGEDADLSSVLSAVLLAKLSGPFIKLGKGAFSLGKTLFGSGGGVAAAAGETVAGGAAAGGTSLVGSFIGSAGAGTGLLGFGANTAINLGAGNLAGGASLSAGALSTLGLGAVAGGVVGGATLISGGLDIYKAIKSDNKEESDAYAESGAWKAGGVAAGAAAGAALGSVIPGLGTAVGALIGAGVGGIAGWIKGNSVKEEYEENLEAAKEAAAKAQKAYQATGRDIDHVHFKTKALADALNDTEVSAEEFAKMFQEAVVKNMEDHFGDIKMSLKEVQEVAADIVFDRQTAGLNKFSDAAQKSEESLASLQGNTRELQKINWEMGITPKLKKADKEKYRETIDSFVKSAKEYLKNQHYEATVALDLLVGDDADGLTDGLDGMYSKLQKKISRTSKKLDAELKIAMKDGVIDIDEQKEITRLQDKITKITQKVTSAQEESSFAALKIKYSGAALDSESFASLQQELQNNVTAMSEKYDNALQVSLTNLQLQLDEGAIDKDTYDELYQKIADGYNKQMKDLQDRVQDFQLDSIAEAYKEELENILPDIEGTTSERLKEAMNKAIAVEPDATKWTTEKISKWFGLDGLDTETQTAVAELLQKTASSVPESVRNALNENYKQNMTENFNNILNDASYGGMFLNAGTMYGNSMTTGASNSILAGSSTLRTSAETSLNTAFADPFSVTANVNVTPNYKVDGSFKVPDIKTSPVSVPTKADAATPSVSGGSAITVKKNAAGGYASSKQLSWIAEEGYGEYIIPTNPSRRQRALELYQQAGRALGVEAHADGGFVGMDYTSSELASYTRENKADINLFTRGNNNAPDGYNGLSEGYYAEDNSQKYPSSSPDGKDEKPAPNISLNVQVSPEFVINGAEGQDEEKIVSVVKRHIREMADELGGEIAEMLEDAFSNMPLEGA